jgi:hypothetical protein
VSDENPYAPPVANLRLETKPRQISLARVFRSVAYFLLPLGLAGLLWKIYLLGGLLSFVGLIFLVAGRKIGAGKPVQ